MDVYLHVGLHKTGTTYLQKKLEINLSHRHGLSCHSRSMVYKSITRPLIENKVGDVSKEQAFKFVEDLKENKKIIISEENLLGIFYSWKKDEFYPDAAKNLSKLSKILGGIKFKVFLTIRNHADWIESMYLQKVKNGYATEFQRFIEKTKVERLLFSSMIANLNSLDCIDEMLVVDYESFKKDPAWYIVAFEGFIGECLEKSPEVNMNPSYSDKQFRLALLGNKILENKESQMLHSFVKKYLSGGEFVKPELFTKEQKESLKLRYEEDIKTIVQYCSGAEGVKFNSIVKC